MKAGRLRRAEDDLLAFALSYPESYEEAPLARLDEASRSVEPSARQARPSRQRAAAKSAK